MGKQRSNIYSIAFIVIIFGSLEFSIYILVDFALVLTFAFGLYFIIIFDNKIAKELSIRQKIGLYVLHVIALILLLPLLQIIIMPLINTITIPWIHKLIEFIVKISLVILALKGLSIGIPKVTNDKISY